MDIMDDDDWRISEMQMLSGYSRGASGKEQYLEQFGNYIDDKPDFAGFGYYDVLDLSEMSLKLMKAVMTRRTPQTNCIHVKERKEECKEDCEALNEEVCEKCSISAAIVVVILGGEERVKEYEESVKDVRSLVMSILRKSLREALPIQLPRLPDDILNIILDYTNVNKPVKYPFFDQRKEHWKFIKYVGVSKHLFRDLYCKMSELYLCIKDALFDQLPHCSARDVVREVSDNLALMWLLVADIKQEELSGAVEVCQCDECKEPQDVKDDLGEMMEPVTD